jgi:hypothetical protein
VQLNAEVFSRRELRKRGYHWGKGAGKVAVAGASTGKCPVHFSFAPERKKNRETEA